MKAAERYRLRKLRDPKYRKTVEEIAMLPE